MRKPPFRIPPILVISEADAGSRNQNGGVRRNRTFDFRFVNDFI